DVNLEALFSSLRSDFRPVAEIKGLSLRFRPAAIAARTDRTLLRRILQNILSNALRYTRSGGVLVGTRQRGGIIRIDVADTGGGIPESQREAVFEEFSRGSVPAELAGGGLGLGLAIVRRMADALDHPVTFSSKVGRGTIFHVDVPLATTATAEPIAAPLEQERPPGYGLFGTRVLLIENDVDVLEAMKSLLERWQCVVRAATSTDEALDALGDTAWVPDV